MQCYFFLNQTTFDLKPNQFLNQTTLNITKIPTFRGRGRPGTDDKRWQPSAGAEGWLETEEARPRMGEGGPAAAEARPHGDDDVGERVAAEVLHAPASGCWIEVPTLGVDREH
jgi:hypothetical protein